jgi:hypothetical protein
MGDNARLSRRTVLAGSVPVALAGIAAAQLPPDGARDDENLSLSCDSQGVCTMREVQRGDPDLPPEEVFVNAGLIARTSSPLNRATLASRMTDFRTAFFNTAVGFEGFNRKDNKPAIGEMCSTLRVPFSYKEGSVEKNTAYCAVGLSYVAALAYAKSLGVDLSTQPRAKLQALMPEIAEYHFYPTVSCVNMFHVALGSRRWIDAKKADASSIKQGMIMIFDWRASGSFYRADHCGLVDSYDADKKIVSTIEFNTTPEGIAGSQSDGGYVARRKRPLSLVKGFIDPDVKNPFSIFQ